MVRLCVNIDEECLLYLCEEASEEGITLETVIQRALEEYIDIDEEEESSDGGRTSGKDELKGAVRVDIDPEEMDDDR